MVKGMLSDHHFYITSEAISTVSEKPVKSIHGKMPSKRRRQISSGMDRVGMETINTTALLGKLKLWCIQFGLLPCLSLPLMLYEAPYSKVKK